MGRQASLRREAAFSDSDKECFVTEVWSSVCDSGKENSATARSFFFSFFLFLEVESVICFGGNYDFDKVERGVV